HAVRRRDPVQLLPRYGPRHRGTLARPRRPGGDGRGRKVVAQVVDEDAALAPRLRHGRDEARRVLFGETFRERAGEGLHLGPPAAAFHGRDDVDALAAREQGKALELQRIQRIAHLPRGALHVREVDARPRVEVEHQAVGVVYPVHPRAPEVDLQDPELRGGEEALAVHYINVF